MNTNDVIRLISAVRHRANELIVNELAKAGIKNIVPSHGYILFNLFKKDGLAMKEITQKIGKRKNTVTVLIDKLVLHGYIRKEADADDRRRTRIYLSQKGKSFEHVFNGISKKLLDAVYKGFSEEEKRTLMKLLEKIENNLR